MNTALDRNLHRSLDEPEPFLTNGDHEERNKEDVELQPLTTAGQPLAEQGKDVVVNSAIGKEDEVDYGMVTYYVISMHFYLRREALRRYSSCPFLLNLLLLRYFKKLSCLWADLAETLVDGRGRSWLPCHQVAPKSATRGRH